jgi:acetolactate synthase-1/2/3 large subunit
MNSAEIQSQILKKEGVDFITLYPDIQLTNAAADSGIRTIMPRKERVAVDIANGVSRVSNGRKIGVCAMQQGAGIQNAYSGIAQAWADSSPVLVLPEIAERRLFRTFPCYNAYDSYRNITKWADTILFPDQIPDLMRRAFTLLRTGRPGPVLLEMPVDVAKEKYDVQKLNYSSGKKWRSTADPRDIDIAVKSLRKANNPVVYAGQGVLYAEASKELIELCELFQLPVLTTMTGKSCFPEDNVLSLGVAAHVATPAAKHFLDKADIVFAVGAGLSRHWMQAPIPKDKKIIQFTNCEHDIGKGYPVHHVLFGDAKLILRQMIDESNNFSFKENTETINIIKEKKEKMYNDWKNLLNSDDIPINPLRFIWDLMKTIDKSKTIVTAESGKARDHTSVFFNATEPRSYVGFGHTTTLGFTLGCAIGAKLVEPKKNIINIMGDGAFGMVGMDLETSVREKIPILTVVLNNSTLSTIGGYPTANEKFGTGSMTGDYTEIAEAMGAYAIKVEVPDDIIPSLKTAIQKVSSGKTTLLEIITKLETRTSGI